ncbi:hypothetical protein AVEN_48983-1 [Araneus ventricosus]|uniref:Uncharacterized protein n=1 Tax=Araneus ventricosus TaxID=182803 RepID=A0A4Y2AH19_ARAVE|nr:hypothetical protein AVEN_48983-1 [Araneus ventricosus]
MKIGPIMPLLHTTTQAVTLGECSGLFLFTQMRIFGTPKSPVLFIHVSIQVEMCFIREPDAANIKSFIINHCESLVRNFKPLSHSFYGHDLMTMDFVWKHP